MRAKASVLCALGALNVLYLDELFTYFERIGIDLNSNSPVDIWFNHVRTPKFLGLSVLPRYLRVRAEERIRRMLVERAINPKLRASLECVIGDLADPKEADAEMVGRLRRFLEQLVVVRSFPFEQHFPEIGEWLWPKHAQQKSNLSNTKLMNID